MSKVWLFFEKTGKDQSGNELVRCKICDAVKPQSRGNTSNLRKHMVTMHTRQWFASNAEDEVKAGKFKQLSQLVTKRTSQKLQAFASSSADETAQSTFDALSHSSCDVVDLSSGSESEPRAPKRKISSDGSLSSSKNIVEFFKHSYPRSSLQHKKLTTLVTKYLVKECKPVYTVESPSFRDMLAGFDSRYQLPHRDYFARTEIPRLYDETRLKVENELALILWFSTTTDMWTSRSCVPFMALTVHWVDESFKCCSRALQPKVLHCPADHTADYCRHMVQSSLSDWNLDIRKQVAITTDNASVMKKMCFDAGWLRHQCFGHRLHLAVKSAMKHVAIEKAASSMRKVIGHFSHSTKKRRLLQEAQVSLNLPKHQLKVDCVTRWGALYAAIERFLEQEVAIRQVLVADYAASRLILEVEELQTLIAVRETLKPIHQLTDMLSGEQSTTISMVLPTLELMKALLKEEERDSDVASYIKAAILSYLEDKYSECPENLAMLKKAAYLDPRFKQSYLCQESLIIAELKAEFDDVSTSNSSTFEQTTISKESAPRSLGDFLNMVSTDAEQPEPVEEDAIAKEVRWYSSLPAVKDKNESPLEWWQSHKTSFRRLSILARKYLCIPATSVPSERLFSLAGNVVSDRRCSLNPDSINKYCFLAANLQ